MAKKVLNAAEMGAKGGKARAESMTPEERSERGRKAAEARWEKAGKTPPQKAVLEGELEINDIVIPCAVLDGGIRVISQRGMSKAFGRVVTGSGSSKSEKATPKTGDAKLPTFLSANNLKPFIDLELAASLTSPIEYTPPHGGRTAYGFKAELVPRICEVWMKAKDAKVLLPSQQATAEVASILIRGLAHVGIIALVDEATGFQDYRAQNALAKILEAFVAKELQKWIKTFPVDFYKELFRLRGLNYHTIEVKKPSYIGHLTNDLVYARLAPGVLKELREKNPVKKNPVTEKVYRKNKHHQWLTPEMGHPKLLQHLSAVIALMRAFDDWPTFYSRLDRALPKYAEYPLIEYAESGRNTGDADANPGPSSVATPPPGEHNPAP
jgi:hypothetical protein